MNNFAGFLLFTLYAVFANSSTDISKSSSEDTSQKISSSIQSANLSTSVLITKPENVILNSDSVVIVTHAGYLWDPWAESKSGIEEYVSKLKKKGLPIVYIYGDSLEEKDYFFPKNQADYSVSESGGYFEPNFSSNHFVLLGGQYSECMSGTVEGILKSQLTARSNSKLTISILAQGTYQIRGTPLWHSIANAKSKKDVKKVILSQRYKTLFESLVPDKSYEVILDDYVIYRSNAAKKRGSASLIFRVLTKSMIASDLSGVLEIM